MRMLEHRDPNTGCLGICLAALNTELSTALSFKGEMSLGKGMSFGFAYGDVGERRSMYNCLNEILPHLMGPDTAHLRIQR